MCLGRRIKRIKLTYLWEEWAQKRAGKASRDWLWGGNFCSNFTCWSWLHSGDSTTSYSHSIAKLFHSELKLSANGENVKHIHPLYQSVLKKLSRTARTCVNVCMLVHMHLSLCGTWLTSHYKTVTLELIAGIWTAQSRRSQGKDESKVGESKNLLELETSRTGWNSSCLRPWFVVSNRSQGPST